MKRSLQLVCVQAQAFLDEDAIRHIPRSTRMKSSNETRLTANCLKVHPLSQKFKEGDDLANARLGGKIRIGTDGGPTSNLREGRVGATHSR